MNVCCINPPIQDFYCTGVRRQPLGLLYVAAAIKNAGHSVSLINGHTPKQHLIPLPRQFDYLKPFMNTTDERVRFPFKHYRHFGASYQEIHRQVRASGADVFFVSCLFTTYYEESAEIISLVRQTNPGAVIVAGGYHAALNPRFYLEDCGVDYVVTGEGEAASAGLLACLSGKGEISSVPNLCFREGNELRHTPKALEPDPDLLPHPARELLRERDFSFYRTRGVSISASRGCPNRCDFCTSREFWGGRYRQRSAASVTDEISRCAETYRAAVFNFEDDNLFPTRSRARELLDALIEYTERRGRLDFTAMNGVSLENLDGEIVALMHRAGFRELNMSLVTKSAELQEKHARPFDAEKVRSLARAALLLDMNVRAYFILGLPDQTKEEIEDTLSFLAGLGVKAFPSVYYDVHRPVTEWKVQRSSAFYNETEHLSRHDLLRLFNRTVRPLSGRVNI